MDRVPNREYMQGLARGLNVIKAFSAEHPRRTAAQIATATGLTRATVRRCLSTLADLGYVTADGREFRLTPRILELGHGFLAGQGIGERVQPILKEASTALGETCMLGLLDQNEVIYVAHATGDLRFLTIRLTAGSRLPLLSTAIGRALVAFLPDDQRRSIVQSAPLSRHTETTETDRGAIAAVIERVRRDGYAISDGEYEAGLVSVGVPVIGPDGQAIAALNEITIKGRITRRTIKERHVPALRACAEQLALVLF